LGATWQPGHPFDTNKLNELMNRLSSPTPMTNNPLGMNQMGMQMQMQPMDSGLSPMMTPQQLSPRMSLSQPQMGGMTMPMQQMGGMTMPMQQMGSMAMPMQPMGGMASPMQQMPQMQMGPMGGAMSMGGAPPMGTMPMGSAPQMTGTPMTPTDGSQSMESLMAEMNQLKQYLNSQQGGV
jgi:hypothetical protein